MSPLALLLLQLQTLVAAPDPPAALGRPAPADTVYRRLPPPRWDLSGLEANLQDTLRRRRAPLVEYSEMYGTRLTIHRVLSYAMVPLFLGSGYTGFVLRSRKEAAPQWVKDAHGPLAAGTAILFGMNTVTGVWNLLEGRKDPEGRTRRLVHSALFIAAGAGFAYVTAAGDNIRASGRPNQWHRNVALGSMGVSLASWILMLVR
jgi:hypothetical protein